MTSQKVLSLFLVLSFFTLTTTSLQGQKEGKKKRIAVFTFNDKSDSQWGWYGNKSVGEGMTDMVITALVKSGNYTVIERSRLNSLLKEQDLALSGIVTQESAAQAGKVLGVEIAVFGSISEFGYKNSRTGLNVPKTGIKVGKQAAVAGIDLRMVNTTTGEILGSENVRKTKSTLAGGLRVKNFNFDNQKDFDGSLVGKATREAVESVVKAIDYIATNLPWQAKVITVNQGKVYINSGAQAGVAVGEVFAIYRQGEALIDPDTGLSLGTVDSKIGAIKVVDNQVGEGKASICEIVEGEGFTKGDVVKEK